MPALLGELRENLVLAFVAVDEDPFDHLVRTAHQEAVTGRDVSELLAEQQPQAREVGGHVAVGRIDHDGRALHEVVAGKEQPLALLEKAELVGRVARRVQDAQREAGDLQALAVRELAIGGERRILPFRVLRAHPEHRRTGARLQRRRRRRMVDVGMGAEDPLDLPARGVEDCFEMRLDHRTGIDHRDARRGVAEQIGVRARPGHRAGIRRGEAANARRHLHRHTGHDLVGSGAFPLRIELADLGIRVVPRHQQLRSGAPHGGARRHRRHPPGRARVVHGVRDAPEAGQELERLDRREQKLDRARRLPLERDARRQPVMIDRLVAVVHRPLMLGRSGDEEARVVAAGPARLGDPVREVREPVGGEPQAARRDDLPEAGVARGLVGSDQLFAGVGVKQARLLKALAHRADPVSETAGRNAEPPARLRVIEGAARRDECRVAVRRVDCAAREDVRAARKRHRARPPHHEHFDPAIRIARDDDCGGGANDGRARRVHTPRTIPSPRTRPPA